MGKYKLSELFELNMGKTPARNNSEYWDNGTNSWISISDLTNSDKYIETTKETITDSAVHETGIHPINNGTVVMSFKLSVGKVAIVKGLSPMYSNEAIMAFDSKDDLPFLLLNEYVYYLLSSINWDGVGNKAVMGKTLNKRILQETEVFVHDYEEQKEIVAQLDKIDEIIVKRKQQLAKLDELVKARFVEMFGDPMTNSKGYVLRKYDDVFELNAGGTPSKQKPEYWENGTVSWIGSNMCQNTVIYQNDGNYITEEGLKHSSARIFPVDTVLIALVGATIGKTALLRFETTTNQNVLGVRRIRESGYTPEFIFYYTQGLYQKFLNIGDGGFAMASKGFISELPVPVVDLTVQEQFTTFVEQVDKSKVAVQKALDEAQTLFDSLMQQYFN